MIIKDVKPFDNEKKLYTFEAEPCERLPFKVDHLLPQDAATLSKIIVGEIELVYFESENTESWIRKDTLISVQVGTDDKIFGFGISPVVVVEPETPTGTFEPVITCSAILAAKDDGAIRGEVLSYKLVKSIEGVEPDTVIDKAVRVEIGFSLTPFEYGDAPTGNPYLTISDTIVSSCACWTHDNLTGDFIYSPAYFTITATLSAIVKEEEGGGEIG